ncbi:DUF29 domain-containing protein [Sphingomonas sp. BIUV-7]|uniref:DUF29 domain-containing protein n=1 Tax=Sphingomonas natans TaxID=3063330 RepID=A0ABT8Y4X7_9SPHN|nr:DUF29 domain-containing protein [Sphingomonas sp. BIUV-7]MDO6413380.1 DUF29 domain-containing protein [Sphingomonas sp. BIUV-7]
MNKPIHPLIASDGGNVAYEDDAYGWAIEQAAHLRAGHIDRLDLINLAEEIEDVAKSERRAAESALRILMMHVLKWQMQSDRRTRSWSLSILAQRIAYDRQLEDNPSLAPLADDMRAKAFKRSRIEAAQEMDVPLRSIPLEPPSWPTILDEPFEVD